MSKDAKLYKEYRRIKKAANMPLPGTIYVASDRKYEVQADGSWKLIKGSKTR
jgi:hypothetical protein